MNKGTLTILGCGNSSGVPAAGNVWGACDPKEPKNKRHRCSALIQYNDTTLVIDTGPDFRLQANRAAISELNAVLFTHSHGDHVNGIDDLRSYRFRQKKRIPVYASYTTFADLKERFRYIFEGGLSELYPPIVDPHVIPESQFGRVLQVNGVPVIPFEQDHGTCTTTGYRFGDLAYSVDLLNLDDKAIQVLKGIKTWVVDCAAYHNNENKVHASLDRIYDLNQKIEARHVVLTSLSLSMDYQTLCNECPDGFSPAYDGLELTFE